MSKVLVVVNDKHVVDLVSGALAADGHEVASARDGTAAIGVLDEDPCVDLLLLDVTTPRAHGMDVLRRLAGRDTSPTVIVLAPDRDGGEAHDEGCVDAPPGPAHVEHLVARARGHLSALAPRRRPAGSGRYLTAGGVSLDLERRRAHYAGADVALSERELGLLSHLMRHRGSVCRRDDLLHDVWGLDFDPGTNVVDVCLRRLRSKMADLPIETVRGSGYCFYGE